MTRFGYEPALDGLRAISVIAVLLYHGGFSWMKGGFLGVEVFFVVSGFLITTLLIEERRRSGAVALGAFWVRRFRRLLPALLVVLVAVTVWVLTIGTAEQELMVKKAAELALEGLDQARDPGRLDFEAEVRGACHLESVARQA